MSVRADPSITARSAALGDPIAPGDTRFYQVYYRDAAGAFCPPETFNATNGVRNNIGVWVDCQDGIHEVVDDLRLLVPLNLGAACGRLEATEEWLITAFGIKVIGDDKQLMAVEGELARRERIGCAIVACCAFVSLAIFGLFRSWTP